MEKKEIIEKIKAVLNAPSCCATLKEKSQKYLDSIGTNSEKAMAKDLIEELEADVMPIESTIGFFASDMAKNIFGAEKAAQMKAHAEEVKAKGGKFCDCPACANGKTILDNKSLIL